MHYTALNHLFQEDLFLSHLLYSNIRVWWQIEKKDNDQYGTVEEREEQAKVYLEKLFKEIKSKSSRFPDRLRRKVKSKVQEGENKLNEFKEVFIFDIQKDEANFDKKSDAVEEICAFANTEGGTLIYGVDDEKNITGIKPDLQCISEGHDGFQRYIYQETKNHVDNIFATRSMDIHFVEIQKKTVCVIEVDKNKSPVFFDDDILYVRRGRASIPLEGDEKEQYIEKHYPSS